VSATDFEVLSSWAFVAKRM